ncbi:MAG TPA: glycine--tRNA ligase subunit beta [Gaiella sp.]|jgi:glycyl-tRNA synthetase beta chain
MTDLLVEIGCDELPSAAVYEAAEQLPALVREHLGAEPSEVFLGPRRIAALVFDLPTTTPEEWIAGPPTRVGPKAAEGFARKLGVSQDDLEERDGVWGWVKPPQPVAETLATRVDAIVRGFAFSKSMVWEAGGIRFSRPVRWTLAVLGDEVVVGESSFGHRFASQGSVAIPSAGTYAETLRGASVEPSLEERRRRVVAGLAGLGDWRDPANVLDEVVNLVEWPSVHEGTFDERFLRLPPLVVETAMQSHQRYFPLGANRFAFVANGGDPAVVTAGNERVLAGRLEDAEFTFERDVAHGIEALAGRLATITFLRGAGSYADKTSRLVEWVVALGGDETAIAAAHLAKADQAAELVREFPELEGHIGAVYARLAGVPEEVCLAIEEHYLPDGADAPLPSTEAGRVLSAADKLDTLTVAFGLGHRPTGSRDPYALRRAAIAVCRLAVEGGLALRIEDPEVRAFVEERLEGLLEAPVEVVRAARGAGSDDLREIAALAVFLAGLDDERLAPVHEVYTRAARIVGDAEDGELVNKLLLKEDAEQVLADAIEAFEPSGELEADFEAAGRLAPIVERFFEDVLVMDKDEQVRANRLRLLRDVRDKVGRLGDFSQIPR